MKPLNKENFLSFYLPVNSLVSYTALSINIMNPALRTRFFGSSDLTNFLLWHTVAGTGAYIYTRKHLAKIPQQKKLGYAAAGGVLFSFGSVLMWAFLKNVLPKNSGVATFVGLSTGFVVVKLTSDYLNDIDAQISEVD
ncbi:hypothetical protein PVAND_015883 [Polypedilum vanderplanki]|uniref:Uncharacterized protein n=1 Tax=Polypedilum vanderplanki TaxID=319348 RepID=A0A9J6BEG4_POLVA|nr:hypothetical protein PVAND_015883 [Polypedilum vanderplanki]